MRSWLELCGRAVCKFLVSRSIIAVLAIAVMAFAPERPARAWDVEHLFRFTDEYGFKLPAGVIRKGSAVYGVVSNGGTLGCGSVFKLTPGALGADWTRLVLHHFTGGSDGGCAPQGELVFGPDVRSMGPPMAAGPPPVSRLTANPAASSSS